MQIATLSGPDKKIYLVRLKDGVATPIARAYERPGLDPLRDILVAGRNLARVRPIGKPFPVARARYYPPVTAPSKLIAMGLTYKTHALETGNAMPKTPMSWGLYPSSLLGHEQTIRYRRKDTKRVDYECELAFVVGRRARDVKAKDGSKYIFGYTVCNDVTARDHQFTEGQFARCKSFDTFTPLGPTIVTADEIPDPHVLGIRTRLNGKVMQDSTTADMAFTCAEMLAYLSRFMTLEPGDVITTSTPSGVGLARKPPVYMRDGDVIEVEVDQIGTLRNRIKVYT